MIEFAAAIGFIIAAIFAGLWWRALSRLQAALHGRELLEQSHAGLAAMLDTVPVAAVRWRRDGGEESALGSIPGSATDSPYSGFLAALAPADAARLSAAVDDLREAGTAFTAVVSTSDGPGYRVDGCLTASGETVLWLADVSEERAAEQERSVEAAAAAALRQAFNTTPMPARSIRCAKRCSPNPASSPRRAGGRRRGHWHGRRRTGRSRASGGTS